jgi:hypothetical protein
MLPNFFHTQHLTIARIISPLGPGLRFKPLVWDSRKYLLQEDKRSIHCVFRPLDQLLLIVCNNQRRTKEHIEILLINICRSVYIFY